jgi:hypothetical protein
MKHIFLLTGFLVTSLCATVSGQTESARSVIPNSGFTADYPADRAGILIQTTSWEEIKNQIPTKTRAKHGIAASLSYGAVPANVVLEYEGDHAQTQLQGGQLMICICHLLSLPNDPLIVRLHPKKNSRELDGGRIIVYPVVGGSKTADASKTDLIAVDIAHPDPHVWLVRPQSPLPAGEYALMLGSQNVNIYPFTVPTSVAEKK